MKPLTNLPKPVLLYTLLALILVIYAGARVLNLSQAVQIIFALLWVAALIAVLTRAWKQNKAWWLVIGMISLLFPHYFITWHGDVMGIYRHVISASIQFYLGMWLLVLLALDGLFSKALQPGFVNPLSLRKINHKETLDHP